MKARLALTFVVGTVAMVTVVWSVSFATAQAARTPGSAVSVNARLLAQASKGYTAELSSEGNKIQLILSRGLFPSLMYTFHGQVSPKGIDAKIADLGSIDLRFLPTGKDKRVRPPRHCHGPVAKGTEGHFVGTFRFRAEMGVSEVDLSHARGSIVEPGWRCEQGSLNRFVEAGPEGATYTLLRAEDERREIGLSAFAGTDVEHPDPEIAEVSAGMITRRGSVKVDHIAVVLGRQVFSFDSALTEATVSPPKPFRGSAIYCASCGPESRWTGHLRVALPGVGGEVSLVGPSYKTEVKVFHASGTKGGGSTG